MDKKKILLLVGGATVIVVVAVVTRYMAMNSDTKKDAGMSQPTAEESEPVVFSANSYSGTIQSIDAEKIVIAKEDGSTEEYQLSALYGLYDNRVRDEMKPLEAKNLEKGMSVQISTTLNSIDDSKIVSLTLYK